MWDQFRAECEVVTHPGCIGPLHCRLDSAYSPELVGFPFACGHPSAPVTSAWLGFSPTWSSFLSKMTEGARWGLTGDSHSKSPTLQGNSFARTLV